MKITAIKQQVARPNRFSVFVDGKYSFSLSDTALLESRIVSGQEISDKQLNDYRRLSQADKSFGALLRYVALRPRSEWETRQYLARKKVEPDQADSMLAKLKSLALLDDYAFANSWIQNRRLLKSVSLNRLRQELRQKHVDGSIVSKLLNDEENDKQALRELIDKKQSRYLDRTKFMAYLSRQGFRYDDIRAAFEESGEDN